MISMHSIIEKYSFQKQISDVAFCKVANRDFFDLSIPMQCYAKHADYIITQRICRQNAWIYIWYRFTINHSMNELRIWDRLIKLESRIFIKYFNYDIDHVIQYSKMTEVSKVGYESVSNLPGHIKQPLWAVYCNRMENDTYLQCRGYYIDGMHFNCGYNVSGLSSVTQCLVTAYGWLQTLHNIKGMLCSNARLHRGYNFLYSFNAHCIVLYRS